MRGPRPNELSLDPARDRAGARLAAYFEAVDRLPVWRLEMLAVRPLDEPGHEAAVAVAVEAARRSGRAELVERAGTAIDEALPRLLLGPNWIGPAGMPLRPDAMRATDQARLDRTLRDAALAVAVEDLIDPAAFDELAGPCADLVRGSIGR